ncbi:MAG: hypothetical protein QW638_03865 [Candidatus Bathyarchaeia archaeon]|nr:hypothetical protein [Candidatus Bathyarchaeota archaeon]
MSSNVEVSRQGLLTAALIAAVLLLSLVISSALMRWASSYPIMPFPREKTPAEVLLNVLLISIPSIITSAFLASAIRYARAILLRGLILLGAFIAVLTARGALEAHGGLPSTLLSWLLMFFVVLSTLSVVVPPPEEVTALIYLVYGTVLGAFIGVNSPTSSILLLLAIFALYDIFFSRWAGAARGRGLEDLRAAVRLEGVDVGVGDIVFYSILASHTMRFFGFTTALLTSTLMIIGGILTLLIASRLGSFPGLPIPLALGVLPLLTFQLGGGG